MTSKEYKFRRGVALALADEEELPTEEATELTEFLHEKMRYQPRQSEAGIIKRIEATVERVASDLFSESDRALKRFYSSVRTPEMELVNGERVPVLVDGEPVWVLGEDGFYEEDWSKLDGMEVEAAIHVLQRVISNATDEVSKLYTRALFASKIQDDEFYDSYRSLFSGTIDERKAHAYKKSRDSRYYYLFLYMIWKRLNDKLENLKSVQRQLEFMRNRFIQDAREAKKFY